MSQYHYQGQQPVYAAPANADDGLAVSDRRDTSRKPVIKSAKIIVGASVSQSVFDCLVLDESQHGVLVDLGMVVNLPDEVTVQMGNGATYPARRRWSVGTKAGLEFSGAQIISSETAFRMLKVSDLLHAQGTQAAVAALRAARFFDMPALRAAAEEAEATYARLDMMLTGRQPV
jgi:hypothetical protein